MARLFVPGLRVEVQPDEITTSGERANPLPCFRTLGGTPVHLTVAIARGDTGHQVAEVVTPFPKDHLVPARDDFTDRPFAHAPLLGDGLGNPDGEACAPPGELPDVPSRTGHYARRWNADYGPVGRMWARRERRSNAEGPPPRRAAGLEGACAGRS